MMLESLELHIGVNVGIGIVQVHDKADKHLISFQMIDEAAAAGILAQGPAHGMRHRAGAGLGGVDFPDLFHAEAEFLRIVPGREIVFADQLLGQRPAHAFGDEDVFAAQFHARLIAGTGGAVGIEPHLARHDAGDAVALVDQLRAGHAGKDLDLQRLGLFGQPATDIAHGDDILAVVRHQRRHGPVRDPDLAMRAEQVEVVRGDLGGDRGALVHPVRDQPVEARGVQHRARQDMRADLGALFQQHHRKLGVELLQPDRSRQAAGTPADDNHVVFHRLALNSGHGLAPNFP